MIGLLYLFFFVLCGIPLIACCIVGLVMSLKERKRGLRTKIGVPLGYIALIAVPILLAGLCIVSLIYFYSPAHEGFEKEIVSEELSIDVSDGTVEEFWDTRGWFGDGEVYAEITFEDDSFGEWLEESDEWHDLPLRGNVGIIAYGGEDDWGDYWSPFITDEYGHRVIPKTENGAYYFADRYGDAHYPQGGSEFSAVYSMNFTFALYDANTRTLYFYLYNS